MKDCDTLKMKKIINVLSYRGTGDEKSKCKKTCW